MTLGCGKLMAYLAMFGYYPKKAYLKCYSSMIHPLSDNSKWPHIEPLAHKRRFIICY